MIQTFQKFHDCATYRKLKSIAVVGGFSGFENDSSSNDYRMVMPALEYLRKTGIDIAAEPEFDSINFADGRNFLEEDKQYDVVFIAHIPNGRNLSWTRMSFNRYSKVMDVKDRDKLANTIASDNSPDAWARRLHKTEAALIVSVGTYIEVGVNYLAQSPEFQDFDSIIAPMDDPALVGYGDIYQKDKIHKIYGRDIDLPYQWMAVAANLHKVSAVIKPENTATDLTQILRERLTFRAGYKPY